MPLLLSMLPLYVFGNIHCAGMCGPLVMMIGRHRYRYYYFLGRLAAFSLAGFAAGGAGEIVNVSLKEYLVPALASFFFGLLLIALGVIKMCRLPLPQWHWLGKTLATMNRSLTLLILQDLPWASFLFGFSTIFLPCGQTIVVFSACAVYGDPLVGLMNGAAFALLTSPSLVAAMYAHSLFRSAKRYEQGIIGVCSIATGILTVCRGLADLEVIPHLIINSQSSAQFHFALY